MLPSTYSSCPSNVCPRKVVLILYTLNYNGCLALNYLKPTLLHPINAPVYVHALVLPT